MRVKICGVKTEKDIEVVVRSGADAVGFLVGQIHASTDFIIASTAARLASMLPPFISPVLVTHLTDPESVLELIAKTGIQTIQLHGGCSVEEVLAIKKKIIDIGKIILAVHIHDNECIPELDDYYPYIDAVLLDSYNKAKGLVGGTGEIHNWNLSAKIINNCPKPVVLAGGLNPENVSDAIITTAPFAVDANTGLKSDDGSRCPIKCHAFVKNAKEAALDVEDI